MSELDRYCKYEYCKGCNNGQRNKEQRRICKADGNCYKGDYYEARGKVTTSNENGENREIEERGIDDKSKMQ